MTNEVHVDVAVIGGGLGGVAAALAAAREGWRVLLSEETSWLGGQLTSQGVPPDEHPWIEQFGCTASYRALRDGIRDYYRQWYPLTASARADRTLNPGLGRVSRICAEPRAGLAVIDAMVAPHRSADRLDVRLRHRPVSATTDGDRVTSVTLRDEEGGGELVVSAAYVLDATETGDLLPLTGTEYVTGFESQGDTGEPSAPAERQPLNMQAVSWCFALDHEEGADHTIDRPATTTTGVRSSLTTGPARCWAWWLRPRGRWSRNTASSFPTPAARRTACPVTWTCGCSGGSWPASSSRQVRSRVTSRWSTGR